MRNKFPHKFQALFWWRNSELESWTINENWTPPPTATSSLTKNAPLSRLWLAGCRGKHFLLRQGRGNSRKKGCVESGRKEEGREGTRLRTLKLSASHPDIVVDLVISSERLFPSSLDTLSCWLRSGGRNAYSFAWCHDVWSLDLPFRKIVLKPEKLPPPTPYSTAGWAPPCHYR